MGICARQAPVLRTTLAAGDRAQADFCVHTDDVEEREGKVARALMFSGAAKSGASLVRKALSSE
jgi:hypothetical protein